MLIYGAPAGHSLGFNLVWLREFSAQLFAGDLYPRWLLNLNGGAGSPVFFFYAPLPFYVASLGSAFCMTCEISVRLAVGEWLLLTGSGLSFYVFALRYGGPIAATAGALIYMLLPYHLEYALWIRQSIGEFGAYVWLPLILLFIDKISRRQPGVVGLAITYALLIFTHLPTALLFSIFLLTYAVILSWPGKYWFVLPRFAAGVAIGIVLSGVYLLPALLYLDDVFSDRLWTDFYRYHRWFFLDGQQDPGPITQTLYPALLVTTAIFAVLWFATRRTKKGPDDRTLWPWIAFISLAWAFMTPVSRPLWELVPVLQAVQFPWRVAPAIDMAVAMAVVAAIQTYSAARRPVSSIALVLAGILFVYAAYDGARLIGKSRVLPPMQSSEQIQKVQYRLSYGIGAQEYLPKSVRRTPRQAREMAAAMDEVSFAAAGGGRIDVVRWAPRRVELNISLTRDTYVTVRQFYFPGWRAQAISESRTSQLDVEPTYLDGFIKIRAPAGEYRLNLVLERRWPEVSGIAISSLVLLLIVWFSCGLRPRKTNSLSR
jgi:hypothetical protein